MKTPEEYFKIWVETGCQCGEHFKELIVKAQQEAYLQALYDFAVWKDGVMYVGCGRLTLKEAQEQFLKESNDKE